MTVKEFLEEKPVAGKALGRSVVEHDPLSRNFPLAAVIGKAPVRDHPREWWRRAVFDQNIPAPHNGMKPESSCTSQAGCGLLIASPARRNRTVYVNLANLMDPAFRWKVYKMAQTLDPWPGENYDGSSTLAAIKALKLMSCVPSSWEYRWVFGGAEELKAGLEVGPVAVGTVWKSGMDEPNSRGVVSNTGYSRGGHAWYVGDYDERTDLFDAWNSWGVGYGIRGRFKVKAPDMDDLLLDNGEAVAWVPPTLAA